MVSRLELMSSLLLYYVFRCKSRFGSGAYDASIMWSVIGILISSQLFYNLSDEECAKIRQRLDQKEALRNKAEH